MTRQTSKPPPHAPRWMRCWVVLAYLAFASKSTWGFVLGACWPRDAWRGAIRITNGATKAGDDQVEAMILTSKLKSAKSPNKLFKILQENMESPNFDEIHASTAYHSFAVFQKRGSLKWQNATRVQADMPLVNRLAAKVQGMMEQDRLAPRNAANLLWSVAQLPEDFSSSSFMAALTQLVSRKAEGMKAQELSSSFWALARMPNLVASPMLPAILAQIPGQVETMAPQALSNSLWAAARLKEEPEVLELVPVLAAQIRKKVGEMIPQHLSNCLRSSVQLMDATPQVLEAVPAMVLEIPQQMKEMKAQDLSNILETLVILHDAVPAVASMLAPDDDDDFMKSAADHLNALFPKLTGKDLYLGVPTVMWACASLKCHHAELMGAVAKRFRSSKKLSPMKDFSLCALLWSFQVLDAEDKFKYFRNVLGSEVAKRNLSEADVERSSLGYSKWNQAKC